MVRCTTQILVLIVLISMLIPASSVPQGISSDSTKLHMAMDYAMSGLIENAKEILIPMLYNNDSGTSEEQIRYVLGAICLFEEANPDCAGYHWQIVLNEAPNSPEASAIRAHEENLSFLAKSYYRGMSADWSFRDQLKTARLFWTYEPPDYKMDDDWIKGEELAISYYNMLLKEQHDSLKHAVLLFDKFMLLAGFHRDPYGFRKIDTRLAKDEDAAVIRKEHYWQQCLAISDSLKQFDETKALYVNTQFLLGVLKSGTGFFSGKIKLKSESVQFFENVVRATEGDVTNLYRIFSIVWLKEYYKKNPESENR